MPWLSPATRRYRVAVASCRRLESTARPLPQSAQPPAPPSTGARGTWCARDEPCPNPEQVRGQLPREPGRNEDHHGLEYRDRAASAFVPERTKCGRHDQRIYRLLPCRGGIPGGHRVLREQPALGTAKTETVSRGDAVCDRFRLPTSRGPPIVASRVGPEHQQGEQKRGVDNGPNARGNAARRGPHGVRHRHVPTVDIGGSSRARSRDRKSWPR